MHVSSHADGHPLATTQWVCRSHFQLATSMHWHAAYSDDAFFQSPVPARLLPTRETVTLSKDDRWAYIF